MTGCSFLRGSNRLQYWKNKSLFIGILFLLSACQSEQSQEKIHHQQLFSFGTLIDISILTNNPKKAQQAIDRISKEFDQLHTQWHPWKDGELGQLNHYLLNNLSTDASIPISESLLYLIQQSQDLSEQSNGLFNPAIGQLVKLWQFDQLENEQHPFQLPNKDKIQHLVAQSPQMKHILLNHSQISSTHPKLSLDFGAFAKGVAIEKMMAILKDYSLSNAIINAGGDLKVIGSKKGKAWRIGIKNPAHRQNSTLNAVIAAINLQDNEALFTSGNYERFFEFNGKHYHHIIDPRTGYPARGTKSVTILANDAALADAASTALFIAGPELWSEVAKKMGLECVMLIAEDNRIYLSSAMAERIELLTDIKPIIISLN